MLSVRLPPAFKPNLRRSPITPHTMRTRTRKLLDDRIDILNGNAVDASPAQQVFRTASAILVLTRVCILVLVSPTDSH